MRRTKRNLFILAVILLVTIVFSVSVGSADLSFVDSLKLVVAKIPFFGRFVDVTQFG